MTEAEWLSSDLFTLLGQVKDKYSRRNVPGRASERKLRLFACACCRRIWPLLTDLRSRDAVQEGERFADGRITRQERDRACNAADIVLYHLIAGRDDEEIVGNPAVPASRAALYTAAEADNQWDEYTPYVPDAEGVASDCAEAVTLSDGESAGHTEAAAQLALFHEIVANPFRPIALDRALLPDGVIQLARTIYIEQAFARMPDLADALEMAGCTDAEILTHCRGLGPHVRGCWVVDLILGKS